MTEKERKQRYAAAGKAFDDVLAAVEAILAPYGFRRYGCVYHRFVDGDMSQAVELRRGLGGRIDQTHLFWVNVGIRIPECAMRTFRPIENVKYHPVSACDLRHTLGEVIRRESGCYDLYNPVAPIIGDILHRIEDGVLPLFAELNSRDAILNRRREFPEFRPDDFNALHEAMIWGRRGDLHRAEALLNEYYHNGAPLDHPAMKLGHQAYVRGLAERNGVHIHE